MKFHEFKISGENLTPAKAKPFETFTPWAAKLWPLPILLLATLVRLYGSTASAIWCDEGSSLLMSQYSPSLIWSHSAHDVHPPLYFLLLHIWIGAFGDSLFSIRFLSVLTGIGTVGLGMWLVYQVATRHAAIVAGVLLALLPIAVRYSQEVRMYSLMGLWLLGATLALVYWVRKPERHRYLVIYVLLMTASFYTHYFTGLCALSHWAYLTVVRSEKRRLVTLPAWWVANSFIVMLYAPWIPGLIDLLRHLDQLRAGGDIGWIEPITMASLPSTLWQYLTLSDAQNLRWPLYLALPLALVLVTGAVCLCDRSAYRFNVLLAIYTFVPLIVVFLVSWKVPLLVERYLMFSALGLPMILAVAIDQLRRHFRYAAFAMLVTVLTVELVGLHNDYQTDDEQFDKLVNYVNENYQANDRIVVSDLFWYFSYVYYNKTGSVPLLYTPPRADGTSGRPGDYGFGTLVNSDADRVYLDSLEMLPLGQTRVWLVSNSAPPDDFASIPGNWNKVSTLKVGDTQVRLYTLRRQ